MTPKTRAFGALRKELEDGIGVLEEFFTNINNFATWWNRMKMEAATQETRTQAIQIIYDSLRKKSVIITWGKLKTQYATYADEV